jgi:predicted MFS family arabinose efflux permease
MLFIVLSGGAIAASPLSLAMATLLPLWVICATSFVLGVVIEAMSVVWTVTMAANIPADKLARVSGYDGLGSMMGMPVGALVAGPLAARIGVSATQYGAAAITLIAAALTLIPREIWTMRSGPSEPVLVPAEPVPAETTPAGSGATPALAGESSLATSQAC